MKRLLLGVLAACCSTLAFSQATEVVVETYAENIGMVGTEDLTGYNTYRIYVKFESPDDFLTAVYGDADFPTKIQGGDNFFNSAIGGLTNQTYQAGIFTSFPDLEFDSFVTIGMDAPADISEEAGEGVVNSVGDPQNDWSVAFEPGLGANGGDIIIDTQTGGSWFPLYPDANAYAGADSLVLIGQFTTDTTLFGVVSVASFVGGNQDDDTLVTLPFSSIADAVFGCVDSAATNFDANANEDDGSCVFACDYPGTQLVINSVASTSVSCNGYFDGSASVAVSGGQGSLLYSIGSEGNATGVFNNLPSAMVTITIADNAGCSIDTLLDVPAPEPLMVEAILSDGISCNGSGDAVLSGSSTGGTGTMMYSLEGPVTDSTGVYFENGVEVLLFENLGPNLYTVYAMDANGCLESTPGISVQDPLPLQIYDNTAPTVCPDSEDGVVAMQHFGGSGAVEYSLDGISYFADNVFEGLAAGTYTFYGSDVNGCIDTSDAVVVGSPAPFETLESLVSPTCFGDSNGAITLEAQGGTVPLSYVYEGDTLDAFSLNMLEGGDYAIDLLDASGCVYDASVTLTQPSEVDVTAVSIGVLCSGDENGSIVVEGTGGSGMGYTYDLDGAGFGPNGEYSGLAAGTYNVTVQDDAECSNSLEIPVFSPDAIDVVVDANAGTTGEEADGVIDITVTGGTEPFSINWDGPDFTSEDEDISGVSAGDYTVTITDGNGCEFVSTTIVVVSGIEELMSLIDVTLFPNPTRGMVEVQLTGLNGEAVTATLTDGLGREVSREELGSLTGTIIERMDLSNFESGVYFLQLQVANAVETLRVVKH